MPSDIKGLGWIAKRGRDPQAWKTYMSALREFRAKTREESLARASVSWAEYRKVKREGVSSWQTQFGMETDGEPLECIKQHFQTRFDSGKGACLDAELERLGQNVLQSSSCARRPLAEQGVYAAVMKGGSSKAVGPDGVTQEIMKMLAQADRGLTELTRFFEGIFADRCPPAEWQQSWMSLLAKVECPTTPAQLRPLLLTSHIGKTFSRIIVPDWRNTLLHQGLNSAVPQADRLQMYYSHCRGFVKTRWSGIKASAS